MTDSLHRLVDTRDRKYTPPGRTPPERQISAYRVCERCWHLVLAARFDPATIKCPKRGGRLHEVEG